VQQQTEVATKDWKKELVYYLKRNQILSVTSDNNDIFNLLNSYFDNLKKELDEINEDVVKHENSGVEGKFYALINGYKSATFKYFYESEGVVLKFTTVDRMSFPQTISKKVAWLMADDNMPFIKTSFDTDGNPKGNAEIFEIEMLDKTVEAYFMNVTQN